MTPEELARAVERLRERGDSVYWAVGTPLAGLIEAAAELQYVEHHGTWCSICGEMRYIGGGEYRLDHAPDCALVALVRAINGEGER